VILLPETLRARGSENFNNVFKSEVEALDNTQLPLQQGLSQSSYVSESNFSVIVLKVSDSIDVIRVKAGIFYAGVIVGSCCADDPTPLDEQAEHCELQFEINKLTAEAEINLLP